MDPDRFQMVDLKRRVSQLEKAKVRADARIRSLQARLVKFEAFFDPNRRGNPPSDIVVTS